MTRLVQRGRGREAPPWPAEGGDSVEEWVRRNLLRRWRAETCLSLRQAAALLGVTFATVSQWERGRKVPRPANFRRLAALTGLSLAGLAGEWHRWLQERPDRRQQ